jgi:lysophospholipase L1-like esterase
MRRSGIHRTGRVLGIILAALIVLEVAGQVAGKPVLPPDPAFFMAREWCYPDQVDRDHELFWRYRPDQVIRGGFLPAGQYTINSRGFRTPEYTDTKPENTQRVVCLGGSTTFGWGVPDQAVYPRQLETQLNRLDPEKRQWQVINLGVSNFSSLQGRRLAQQVLPALDPDVVLINFSWGDHQPAANDRPDSDMPMPSESVVGLCNTANRLALVRWDRKLWRQAFGSAPQPSHGPTAWRVSPTGFSSNIQAMCRVSRETGARTLAVTSPISLPPPGFSDAEGLFLYHHMYRRIARYAVTLEGGEFVEMANAFDEHREFFDVHGGDFEHFNAKGHAFAGEFLARYLLDLLREPGQAEG